MATHNNLSSVISKLWCQSPDKLNGLSTLKTNRQRVDYAYSSRVFDDAFNIVPNGKSMKSGRLSEQFRMNGNKMFKTKRYEEALKHYTESLLLAPFPSGNVMDKEATHLAVAFSNRSAALYHLSKYSSCLKDINYSLEHGYPVDQVYKLHDRAGRCHLALCRHQKAAEAFESALGSLEQSSLQDSNKKKWSLSLCRELKKISSSPDAIQDCAPPVDGIQCPEIPPLKGNPNSNLPDASSFISLKCSEELGRHMVSNGQLHPGDVVFSEWPYVAILHAQFYKSYCFCCHIAVSLPYPCQQCSEVVYCSKQCQLESWPVHSVECKNLSLLAEDWVYKLGHLALLAVISAPREMLQSASVLEASDEGNTSYHRFCQLVTHEKDREPDSNIQLVTMAVYLTEVLKSVQFLKDLEEKLVCQHILHALQIVQCNGIALTQMLNTDQFHHSKPQSIGQAVCLALALANHSCDPDMELCFYGNRCIARVVKVVDTGSQLCYDYGPVFTLQGKTERKKYLQENYYFTCNCAACRNDWPLFGELNETRLTLKCQKCHQSLPLLATSDVITCKRCDEQLSVGMTLTELSKSHDEYALASKRASCGKLLEALPVLVRHLERLDSFVCEPWKEFYSCQATIKQCYRLLGAKYGQNCGILC